VSKHDAPFDREDELVDLEGLREEVIRAGPNRLYGHIDRTEGGHPDHREGGPGLNHASMTRMRVFMLAGRASDRPRCTGIRW
jgi:hypothetical protein